jgi:hypothetical protein
MNNEPAFPAPAGVSHITEQGMTLRDYFAAQAMQGMLAACTGWSEANLERLAKCSYSTADAMLKARKM